MNGCSDHLLIPLKLNAPSLAKLLHDACNLRHANMCLIMAFICGDKYVATIEPWDYERYKVKNTTTKKKKINASDLRHFDLKHNGWFPIMLK